MFIAKKSMNLRRANIKINAKAEEIKNKENKPADKEKKQQPKKEAAPVEENKPEGEAK